VSTIPLSVDIAGALARLYLGDTGPTYTVIGRAIVAAGFGGDDPFDTQTRTPSKEERLHVVLTAALRRPAGARKLVEGLLSGLRSCGYFDSPDGQNEERPGGWCRSVVGRGMSPAMVSSCRGGLPLPPHDRRWFGGGSTAVGVILVLWLGPWGRVLAGLGGCSGWIEGPSVAGVHESQLRESGEIGGGGEEAEVGGDA
jgi:hypothetical protein